MAIEEVTKRLRIESNTSPVEKAAADIQKVADAEARLAVESQKSERAQLSLENAFSKIERRYVTGIRQQQELEAVQKRVNAAVAQNPALQERANTVMAAASQRLSAVSTANDNVAKSTGLARHEMINFSRQVQDIGVSLASGQSPFTVLVQQGTQVADIFASSQGTIGGFFKQVVSGAASVLTPLRVAVGGMAAFGTAAVAAAVSWGNARHEVEMSLLGIGRASGATVGEIEKIAKAGSSTFGLSISEAREFASVIAATGRVGVEQIGDLVSAGKNLALVLGVDSTKAAETLAKALSDPGRGVVELNQRLGAFDAATVRLVQNLTLQNRIMEAQKVITDGVKVATEDAGRAASTTTNFWTALGNTISNVWSKVGEGAARATGIGLKLGIDEQIENAKREIEILEAVLARRGGRAPGLDTEKRLERQRALLDELTAAQQRFNERLEQAQRSLESQAQQRLVRDLSPEIAQMETLSNRAIGLGLILQQVQRTGGEKSPLLEAMGQTLEQVALAAERAKGALDTALSPAQRLTAEFELSVQAVTARTAAERVALAGQQERTRLAGQSLSVEERSLAIMRAEALEAARLAQAHRDSMAALRDQLTIAQARTGQEKLIAQEAAIYNQLLREGRTHEQASLESAIQRKIAQENINNAVREQTRAIRDQNELIEARLNNDEANVRAAQAYRNAIRQGADATVAAAQSAAVLEGELLQAEAAAARMANSINTAVQTSAQYSASTYGGSVLGDLKSSGPLGGNSIFQNQSSNDYNIYPTAGTGITSGQLYVYYRGQVMLYTEALKKQAADLASQTSASSSSSFSQPTGFSITNPPSSSSQPIQTLTTAIQDNTAAVIANTGAVTIGLSEFYTQQGDRLLGYRGYRVQSGGSLGGIIPAITDGSMLGGATVAGGTTTTPTGMSSLPVTPSSANLGPTRENPYGQSGPNPTWGNLADWVRTGRQTIRTFADGGIADRPTLGMFGEAGAEAFVRLKDGAIPVQFNLEKLVNAVALRANENKQEVHFHAPLVMFAAEPGEDAVRETAFQAGQMLRRQVGAGR